MYNLTALYYISSLIACVYKLLVFGLWMQDTSVKSLTLIELKSAQTFVCHLISAHEKMSHLSKHE